MCEWRRIFDSLLLLLVVLLLCLLCLRSRACHPSSLVVLFEGTWAGGRPPLNNASVPPCLLAFYPRSSSLLVNPLFPPALSCLAPLIRGDRALPKDARRACSICAPRVSEASEPWVRSPCRPPKKPSRKSCGVILLHLVHYLA